MGPRFPSLVVLLLVLPWAARPALGQPRQPVYVGAQACAACHDGKHAGDQFSRWHLSKHAKAYSSLAKPESKQIALLSGIPMEPRKSAMCLGCHATGAEAEEGEKDLTFSEKEGVSCEKCHGPGSEHVDAHTLGSGKGRASARLVIPSRNECLMCHKEKGSHARVLHRPPVDLASALAAIAHPIPPAWRNRKPDPPPVAGGGEAGSKLTGMAACEECHRQTDAGFQFDAWQDNPRARQFAHSHGILSNKTSLLPSNRPTTLPSLEPAIRYKTPLNLALRPGANELYVTCEAAYSVIVVDPLVRRRVAEIPVGGQPMDVAFSPDGQRAYVSNRLDDSVSVVDAAARKVIATVAVGDEPHGLVTDRSGKLLYVLNAASDDISVIDTASLKEIKRLAASRGPWSLALSPDGAKIYVTNMFSRFVPYRKPSVSEVTVIDAERATIADRIALPDANLVQGVAWHPSGKYALVTLLRTKNLVPMTRMVQGWTITNGLGIVWADGRVDQVLLDEPGQCFPDPIGIAITPDGLNALVTSSGTDQVAVVDLPKLIGMLQAADPLERRDEFPNHLGKSAEFVVAHVATKDCPRGIFVMPDGKTAFVANSLDDSLTVIDVPGHKAAARIDLGGPKEITKIRYGERLFHSAKVSFRRQLSCHSCHPDGHVDGLTYDIEEDGPKGGIGKDPVDNRTLRGILDTAPFKWSAANPSLARQCGPRLSVFFTRLAPFTPEQLDALDTYICTIPRPANRYRPVGAPLTESQRRGQAVFHRTMRNDGSVIPKGDRCATCHSPPLYTDRNMHDVGTRGPFDSHAEFDTPHLNNIYDSAPYLHDGKAVTLEEIWTRYNPADQHGVTNDMTKDQLNDLIEYLKTL